MRLRLRQLRAWLERNGLSPKGKLAFLTWYLVALDLLLFVIQKAGGLFRSSFGQSLGGWITFLSLIVIVFLAVLAGRWLSSKLLWRMRNRLLLTSAFIGVIPLILLVGLAGLAFYLFSGQFATYIVTAKLDAELKALQTSNRAIASELAATLDEGRKAEASGNRQATPWNDRQLCAWLDGKLLFNQSSPGLISASPSLPGYVTSEFARVVRDHDRLYLRSAIVIPTKSGKLTVISSKPLDQRMLLSLAADLGEVTLYASGLTLRRVEQNAPPTPGVSLSVETPSQARGERGARYELDLGTAPLNPTFTVGNVPAPTRILDQPVHFPTAIYVVSWSG